MELPERSSEGHELSSELESLPVVFHEVQQKSPECTTPPLSRERLRTDLQMIDGCLRTYEFSEYDVFRIRKETVLLKTPVTPEAALQLSLDSIDQRMLSLFGQSIDMDILEEEFPFYTHMANKSRLKPLLDDAEARKLRYELLDEDLGTAIQSIDYSLDRCDAKQVNRYKLAFNLFRIYKETLGAWRGHDNESFPRPWNQPTILRDLVPFLSETAPSDITPLPEIKEND